MSHEAGLAVAFAQPPTRLVAGFFPESRATGARR
jgi:hypothetical protein